MKTVVRFRRVGAEASAEWPGDVLVKFAPDGSGSNSVPNMTAASCAQMISALDGDELVLTFVWEPEVAAVGAQQQQLVDWWISQAGWEHTTTVRMEPPIQYWENRTTVTYEPDIYGRPCRPPAH